MQPDGKREMRLRYRVGLVLLVVAIVFVIYRVARPRRRLLVKPRPTRIPTTKVAKDPKLSWWKKAVIYQIYPRSFKDSNGDGVGDLKGITEKLRYLQWLGIDTIWISPIYRSPMADFGYDISDYKDIDPLFGTMDDFDELIATAHRKEIRVIMDFVPNHTSNLHPWFVASNQSATSEYSDYYIWRNGTRNEETGAMDPPNNWMSYFGGSCWTWSEERGMYYYHSYLAEQPDLNYRNEKVKEEMDKVLLFWLEKGVDGFRIDALQSLVEDADFKDEPVMDTVTGTPFERQDFDNKYTEHQQGTYDMLGRWTKLVKDYGKSVGRNFFITTETYGTREQVMKFYDYGASFPFNFILLKIWNDTSTASDIKSAIVDYMSNIPPKKWPNWVLSNHDNTRLATRLGGSKYTDVANMVLLGLPGTPTAYYGDEIGMESVDLKREEMHDPVCLRPEKEKCRDRDRTPMQWSPKPSAGFTDDTAKPWLPVHSNYQTVNVETMRTLQLSHLQVFKHMLRIRRRDSFTNIKGFKMIDTESENILCFMRFAPTFPEYLVIVNLGRGSKAEAVDVTGTIKDKVGKVVIASSKQYKKSNMIDLTAISLSPGEGLVMELSTESNM